MLSEDDRKLVQEQFSPKQTIAVHISSGEAEETVRKLKKDNPEVIALIKILEERGF